MSWRLVVLFVEDDAENRVVVATCLEQHGARVIASLVSAVSSLANASAT